jgi:hypothetical protein
MNLPNDLEVKNLLGELTFEDIMKFKNFIHGISTIKNQFAYIGFYEDKYHFQDYCVQIAIGKEEKIYFSKSGKFKFYKCKQEFYID